MKYYLGIDIGTFESKGVLVDQSGRIVASAARPHQMLVPQPGWAEHRAEEDWWQDFTSISKQLLADSRVVPEAIKAVAVSAIGPCMLPVDNKGYPLMNAVLYGVDGRAAQQIDELNASIGQDTILQQCGNALTTQAVGPKILWLKQQRPGLFKHTARILSSSSYLVHKLTGRYIIDHFTAAGFSPLYLADKLDWSDELCPDLIDIDLLPELAWSNEIVGGITTQAASETGLAAGTPVTAGTIDAAAEAFSVGVTDNGDMMIMYGSTIFIILLSERRIRDSRLWYAPWLFQGQYAAMAGAATSGTLTHWFRNNLARELAHETAFEELTKEAANSPPGANGLVFLPYFSGERTPMHDPNARGSWFGFDLTHTRADMYRALLEGIAMGTNHMIETYQDAGGTPAKIRAVGGGTKNAIWSQATSDFCAKAQQLCEKASGASYGDAFLAALAVGDVSIADIANWNPVQRTIEPVARPVYTRQYQVFKDLYSNTAVLMKKLGQSEH